jgi:Tol biopolymer transport system component
MIVIAAAVNGKQQLWLRSLESLQTHPLPATEDASYPFWSPDSRNIGFFAQGKIKKIAAMGGPSQTLCDAIGPRGAPWNREDAILFSATGGIQRVPASGGVAVDIVKNDTGGAFRFPVFSPDDRRFLYTNIAAESPGIYLSSLDDGKPRRLLGDRSKAVFVPDATKTTGHLLFVREGNLMAVPFDIRTAQVFADVVAVSEGIRTSGANAGYAPFSVSEEGVLVFSTSDIALNANQAVWYDRGGKSLGPMESGAIFMPAIAPNEKAVAFLRAAGGNPDIWVRDLVRATDDRLTSGRGNKFAPTWSPNSDNIAYTSSLAWIALA